MGDLSLVLVWVLLAAFCVYLLLAAMEGGTHGK